MLRETEASHESIDSLAGDPHHFGDGLLADFRCTRPCALELCERRNDASHALLGRVHKPVGEVFLDFRVLFQERQDEID